MSERDPASTPWRQQARKVARKINLAWWLDRLAVPLVVTALIGSCLILLARRELPQFPWLETSIVGVLLLAGMALLAWWLARKQFESADDAMTRMEATMKMRNALSAAKAGVAPWPNLPSTVDDGTRWRWSRLLSPILAAAAFLGASIFLPVSARTDPAAESLDQPQAWKQLEADIEALNEDETIQEEYLEELQKRLDELRKQEEDEWFSHSSLEATDALRKMHQSELNALEHNLNKGERALNALQKHGGNLSENARQRMLEDFQEALQGLGEGKMKPNQGLLDQLKQLDPQNLGQLNQEQLDQLRENMRQHAQQCQQCQGGGQQGGQNGGQGQGGGEDWLDELLEDGNRNGNPNGREGGGGPDHQGPGEGGINRGPGTAPGVLGRLKEDVERGNLEGLESEDLTRSLPGDLLQLEDGEHEIDKTQVGSRAGGTVSGEGKGGSRVWKDSLLPAEKKALKDFFK